MTTGLSSRGGFEPLDEAALNLIRTLPAQWSGIYETLSKLECDALIGLVAAGFAECKADVLVSKKRLLRTQHFHLLYSFSGGGKRYLDLWKARIRKDTGIEGEEAVLGGEVWEFAITSDGENARRFVDLTPSMVIYQFRYGQPDFQCNRFGWNATQRSGTVAQAAAQAVANNVNNIHIHLPEQPAPVVNITTPPIVVNVSQQSSNDREAPQRKPHGAAASTPKKPDKGIVLRGILWKHHFNDDEESNDAEPMKQDAVVSMMTGKPGWAKSAVSILFSEIFGSYDNYVTLVTNDPAGLRKKLADSLSRLPRTDGNETVSRFTE